MRQNADSSAGPPEKQVSQPRRAEKLRSWWGLEVIQVWWGGGKKSRVGKVTRSWSRVGNIPYGQYLPYEQTKTHFENVFYRWHSNSTSHPQKTA